MQFLIIYENFCGINLEKIEASEKNRKKKRLKVVKTPEDMNEFMFGPLRITKKEKKEFTSKARIKSTLRRVRV